MATPDRTGQAASPPEGEPLAAGAFIPDAAVIERLANSLFQDLTGGASIGSPAIPVSPPPPWSAPVPASVIPAQPPFAQPEVPTDGVPSSVPYRSLGASAESASPFAFVQSRAVAPAVSQTAIAAPRVDPRQAVERRVPLRGDINPDSSLSTLGSLEPAALVLSPFSAPVDLSTALGALRVLTRPDVTALSVGAGDPSGRSPTEPAHVIPGDAVRPPASPARPPAIPTAATLLNADRIQSAERVDTRQSPGGVDSSQAVQQGYERSPFAAPIDFSEPQRGWTAAAFRVSPTDPAETRDRSPTPAASDALSPLPAEPSAAVAPTASAAAAPTAAIAPVFIHAGSGTRIFDAPSIRNDFPILQEKVHGRRLIWLDNGATTQKPQAVIDRLAAFYAHENSNVHRGAHTLAARATDAYEAAREKVRRFIGASSANEVVFVRGTTEGINLVAQAWGRRNVKGDEIVITWLEHHANIVPSQQLCLETGARLRVAPVDDNGDILLDEYEKLLGPRTRIVALSQVSNALGTVTPAREMIAAAHRHGALTLVDGAQSVAHKHTDVQALDADFLCFRDTRCSRPQGSAPSTGSKRF
jgi:cysteine desulfurase/selenocysteine lyase